MSDKIDQNKALVRCIYEDLWNRADPSVADEIFAHPEGVKRFLLQFLAAFPDLQHRVDEMIAEGDRVAARFIASGTHRGEWRGLAPTGKQVSYTGVTLARIQDGKIIEHHTWWDTLGLLEQIEGK
jgi:steroid delta-isomerase-like uncharacterized protein